MGMIAATKRTLFRGPRHVHLAAKAQSTRPNETHKRGVFQQLVLK